jgi:hypothetical protein
LPPFLTASPSIGIASDHEQSQTQDPTPAQARKDFIAAVEARANLLGMSEKNGKLEVAPSEKKGDVTLIAGQAWPAKVQEAIAYTWFNRFAALRYMELHDYLGHGQRVLSSVSAGWLAGYSDSCAGAGRGRGTAGHQSRSGGGVEAGQQGR